ncbi:MAG TPA: glycosyltransferase [Longilinea sp.]|nr:glycosyltransferase [Longilinea sp.]
MTTRSLSVVVPVYHGEPFLEELASRLAAALPKLCSNYEVIFVNDCSPDKSWQVITALAKEYPWVHGIDLMRNYGQHNATLCGIHAAQYDTVVTMDDDLQHQPEDIHLLLEKMDEGYDVVYGAPRKLPQGLFRNLATWLTKTLMASVMNIPSVRHISAFRAFKTNLREAFANFQNPNVIIDVLLSWGTTRFTYTYVDIQDGSHRKSTYSLSTLVKITMQILTGYSTAPLRFASLLGIFIALIGAIILVYIFVIYFTVGSIPGFPFLASIITVFSGVQLFTLGIFGEYLAHIFDRSMDRPTYIISESTRNKESGS